MEEEPGGEDCERIGLVWSHCNYESKISGADKRLFKSISKFFIGILLHGW